MTTFRLQTEQINKEGSLAWEYNPLHNILKPSDTGGEGNPSLSDFDTEEIKFDINHPVDIECQPSYDGSVNLIFNDDFNYPRIVNSGFTLLEDNKYERVSRNQSKRTNIYDNVDLETRLQRSTDKNKDALKISLDSIFFGGELKGGNYIFLFKYSDDDDNHTRIIAESSVVSIFKNDLVNDSSVEGTLADERTNLAIKLKLNNVDGSFSKIKVLYKRNYSDLNGVLQQEYEEIVTPFKIPETDSNEMFITITGVEPVLRTTYDDIIKQFNTYKTVKTQTQVQNMLFFGNVEETHDDEVALQRIAYQVEVIPTFGGSLSLNSQSVYRSTKNLYDNLGYMPGEFYRLGIVFVYDDESVSQAYNLRGCCYSGIDESNIDSKISLDSIKYNEILINNDPKCYNTRGVFRMPEIEYQMTASNYHIHSIVLRTFLSEDIVSDLKKLGIRGYFFVRQARIPLFLGQGLSIGISETAHCPLLHRVKDGNSEYGLNVPLKETADKKQIYYLSDENFKWFQPSDTINRGWFDGEDQKDETTYNRPVKIKGLICSEAHLIPQLQSILDGSEFILKPVAKYKLSGIESLTNDWIYNILSEELPSDTRTSYEMRSLITIPAETPIRAYKEHIFSSKCGSSTDIRSSKTLLAEETTGTKIKPEYILDDNLVRSNFGTYLGVCGDELQVDTIYNIYSKEHPGESLASIQQYIQKIAYNNVEYFAISDRCYFSSKSSNSMLVTGGDCFYCAVGEKLQYNFLDNNAPLNDVLVSSDLPKTYGDDKKRFAGQFFSKIGADGWLETNVSDWNAVKFGIVLNYTCMSNYNLNVRAIDSQHVDEKSLYGSDREFYPKIKIEKGVSFKLPESKIFPFGNSSTLRCFPYYVAEQVPFIKKHFDNRIAFSNVQANDSFSNSYRVFTSLSYQDIERTYGAIVKLVPLGSSLFCVFEHGCGVVPINEKALLSTAQGQSIHLYGSQVIQSQVTVVSQDYGSTWEDSIITTPNGIYGVDTWAKKIWRYNSSGFSIISDQLVQRYLNDNITLSERDVFPVVAVKNIKSHYNNFKGDVMFTFYNNDKCWNLCFNERVDKFITRYSWTPLLSENIQNSFVSIDRTAVENYALMAKNMEGGRGKLCLKSPKLDYSKNAWNKHILYGVIEQDAQDAYTMSDVGFYNSFDLNVSGYLNNTNYIVRGIIKSVTYATWDAKQKKVIVNTIQNTEDNCFKHEFKELSATFGGKDITIPSKGDMFCLKWGDDFEISKEFEDIVEHDDDIDKPTDELPEEEDDILTGVINYTSGTNDHGFSLTTAYNNFKLKARNYVAVEKGEKLRLNVKLNDFVCWLRINIEATPYYEMENVVNKFKYSTYSPLEPFTQTIVLMPEYEYLKLENIELQQSETIDYKDAKESYDKVNRVGFYTHGRAGIYDEINYTDSDPDNEIKPTFWYNKQEPFEFEFVVNSGAGMQKIFDNLAIIANNAEPESLEFSLIGDAYDFNKAGIFKASQVEPVEDEFGIIDSEKTEQEKLRVEFAEGTEHNIDKNLKYSTEFPNCEPYTDYHVTVSQDPALKQYYLHVPAPCRKVSEFGRLMGNIEYREDKWLLNITPLYYQDALLKKENGVYIKNVSKVKSTKLRDKWCKVRIKYKGDKLVVISAIQTMFTISYS